MLPPASVVPFSPISYQPLSLVMIGQMMCNFYSIFCLTPVTWHWIYFAFGRQHVEVPLPIPMALGKACTTSIK